jgi:glycosyltransferase involved in cell wall biosynthesis
MKIGHISHAYKPITGGQETYLKNLFDVLAAAGHEQRVYQLDTGFADPELRNIPRLPRRLRNTSVERYLTGFLLLLRHGRILRSEDALLVHYAFYQPWLLWHSNCVVLSHGVEWDNPVPSLGRRFRAWLCRMLFHRFTRKMVVNDTNYLRAMGKEAPPGQGMFQQVFPGVWFIPNCVNTDYFSKTSPLPEFAGERIILVPRNLVRQRGVDLALQAFSLMLRESPEWKMLVIGDSSDSAYKEELRALASQLGLGDSVRFLGSIAWDRMPAYYSSATITWIPTLWCEGTSLSALESMSCGTPVISTNVGGLVDLPCVHVAPTPEAMAGATLELLGKYGEVADRQRTLTRELHNLGNWSKAWIQVFQS